MSKSSTHVRSPGTFALSPSLVVSPGEDVIEPMRTKAVRARERLKLSAPERVNLLMMYWSHYLFGKITADYLRERSPFVASGMERLRLL